MNRFEPKMRELYALPIGFEYGEGPIRLTEEQIQEAERLIGGRLPEDYREFVRDFGHFNQWALLPPREGYAQTGVGYFMSIIPAKRMLGLDFVSGYLERDPQWFLDDAIIISIDGNVPTFLYFKGSNKGKIYLRDYEEFCLVADSFTEFMLLLKNEFDEPEIEDSARVEDAALFWNSFSTD